MDRILDGVRAIVGADRVLTDPADKAHYGKDWTRQYEPAPMAVALPQTTAQVAALVQLANREQLALVPSGGRTGLSGGAVAKNGELVVAMDRMNQIVGFSAVDRSVRCQAGVVTAQLQQFAEEKGLYYPVDFASAGSSQIGGNLSTNAGGIKVIRYGMTRQWCAGLQVVTGKGDVLELNRDLAKNATGYDLRHLFIGAEGTLGFITEATMWLTRQPRALQVMVLGVPDTAALMHVLQAFQGALDLTAFEFFSDKALRRVLAKGGLSKPFATAVPYYALVEFEALNADLEEQANAVFERCVEAGWVVDGVVSQSRAQAKNLWRLREDISESLAPHTPYKNDISVTVGRVPEFLRDLDAIVGRHYPQFEVVWFGHIGDGNLHLNVLKPPAMDNGEFFAECQKVNQWVFELVQRHHGSISAEHGVGLVKRDYLQFSRSAEEIAYLRALKAVFDPNGVCNPGKVLT